MARIRWDPEYSRKTSNVVIDDRVVGHRHLQRR